jgi:hypothetical protein
MGGDHGLALQEFPDPLMKVRPWSPWSVGVGVPGPCRIVAANLLTNRFTPVSRPTPPWMEGMHERGSQPGVR